MKEQTKGKIKGIISGVIIGATIAGTAGYAAVQTGNLRDVITSGVSIVVDGKKINLGLFENKEQAIKVRKEAEEKYFGEFSYDNSQSYTINI